MWNLVAGLASSASGILALLAVVAGLLGLGAFEQHKIDANSLTSVKADYAKQSAAALAACNPQSPSVPCCRGTGTSPSQKPQ